MNLKSQNSRTRSGFPKGLHLKTIFLGTSGFGVIILQELIKANYKPILVVTVPDKPVGRKQLLTPPPVKLLAEKYKIPILQPRVILNLKSKILNLNPDLIVVAAYGQIIPKEILDIPKYGCLNIHPSLLPMWRGASPIQFTILNGDRETGVTIILMDEKMDHGPILAQRELEIPNDKIQITNKAQNPKSKITYTELNQRLAELAAELLIDTIPKWIKGEINPLPQDESKATYTKILKKEDGKIDWTKPAVDIERQIRAFNPWPGVYTVDEDLKTIKILKADVLDQTGRGPSGPAGKTFLASNDKIAVQCGKDYLIIEELQPEGKKKMTAKDFLMGRQNFIGKIFR